MTQPHCLTSGTLPGDPESLDALFFDLDALAIPWQQRGTVAGLPLSVTEPARVNRALTFPDTRRGRCRVPGCRLKQCGLGTHQTYDPNPSRKVRSRKRLGRQAAAALKQIELYGKELPSADGVDGFPTLPIEETLDPSTRSLFHFFFTDTFDKLALLFRGPSITNLVDFKQRMLATSLASEAYCRSLILHAQTEQDMSRQRAEESPAALDLHTKTLTAFREQIALIYKKPHPLHIELALLVLCILMMYESSHGREQSQRLHWQGMRNLVTMRGGMHCVTMAVAYVIHADRSCAVDFDELPAYTNPLTESALRPLPAIGSAQCGARFRSMKQGLEGIDQTVLEYLVDVSELIEMWEETTSTGNTKHRRGAGTSLEYLHYTRDRLDEQFTVLNARWARLNTTERCLLWASRIVEYPCTWANYVGSTTRKLSRKLARSLQQGDNIWKTWLPNLDIFKWILFALVAVEPTSEAYSWGIEHLRATLDAKHSSLSWPHDWWNDEQQNLLSFVWPAFHYAAMFKKICLDVEQGRCGSTISQQDPPVKEELHSLS